MSDNSEDFFSIGMGFVTPVTNTSVKKQETKIITKKNNDPITVIRQLVDENNEKAEKSIDEDKEKSEIINESIVSDSDSAIDENQNASESYIDREKRIKTFSLEDAMYSVIVTEDINSASNKELKAIGNLLILTKRLSNHTDKLNSINNLENPSSIILQNMIKSDTSIHTTYSYLNYKTGSIEEVYSNLIEFTNNFATSGEIGENVHTLQLLGDNVLKFFDKISPGFYTKVYSGSKTIDEDLVKITNFLKEPNGHSTLISEIFGIIKIQQNAPFSKIVENIEAIELLKNSRNTIININISDKFDTAINNIKNITEKNDISISVNDKITIEKITEMVYHFTKIINEVIINFSDDLNKILSNTIDNFKVKKEISKEDVDPFLLKDQDRRKTLDPFIVSDYHFLDDLLIGDKNLTRTNKIIEMHNKYITKNDYVIFLGDLTGSEILNDTNFNKKFDENHTISEKLKELTQSLNFKKIILILGNNDCPKLKEFYLSCGFDKIYENSVLLENPYIKPFGENSQILLSHEPIDLEDNENILNIHGHLHGTKKYINIDPKNHIDDWYGLYTKPMRMSELIEFYNSGKYNGLSRVNISK